MEITRQQFLKGIAAAGAVAVGAGAASASAYAAEAPAEAEAEGDAEEAAPAAGPMGRPVHNFDSSRVGQTFAEERVGGYAGPGAWLGEPPEIADSDVAETIDVDVVILGSGHSGVGAAMGATDAGLSTAVIEQMAWDMFVDEEGTGANMSGWYGEDIGHVNSQFLIDRGFGPYDTGEITQEFVKRAAGRCNPQVISAFVQNSGAMLDRMHEIYDMYPEERQANDSNVYLNSMFLSVGDEPGYYDLSDVFAYPLCNTHRAHFDDVTYPIVGGGYKTWPCNAQFMCYQGNSIEFVHKYIVKHAQENGATYYFEHTGLKLAQNEDGDVTGLYAKDKDGNIKLFRAKMGVILCAGDFIGNPQMCWALLNEGMEWGERAGYTADDWSSEGNRRGDGHKMACWAGGMIEPSPRGWMAIGGAASGPWGSAPLLSLNAKGKRYMNEASIQLGIPISLRQPTGISCYVTDAKWAQTVGRAPLDHGAPNFGYESWWDAVEEDMANYVTGPEGFQVHGAAVGQSMTGTVYAADTLEELADYLGYEGEAKQTFLDSIARYNELCAAGADTDFGKEASYMVPVDEPPFYGGTSSVSHSMSPMMVTLSGMVTDEYQNVLDKEWNPIKGLYAAGNCLGGRYGLSYNTPFAGNSVGMALTNGWVAARNIAQANGVELA